MGVLTRAEIVSETRRKGLKERGTKILRNVLATGRIEKLENCVRRVFKTVLYEMFFFRESLYFAIPAFFLLEKM